MSEVTCPRCEGKKMLDTDDIKRLELDESIMPGPCTLCNETGKVEYTDEDLEAIVSKLFKIVFEMLLQEKSDKEIIENLEENGVTTEMAETILEKAKTYNAENQEKENEKKIKSPAVKITLGIIAVPYIMLICLLYVYITALNPMVYLNFLAWIFFGFLLTWPVLTLCNSTISKVVVSILISTATLYLVYGMKSTIFYDTLSSAILKDGSLWIPKLYFGDLFKTLLSSNEYMDKLNFLLEFDILNLSLRPGMKSHDTGTGFTNFCRIIECLGIYIIPLYSIFNSKD